MSTAYRASPNAATTSIGVDLIICSRKSTTAGCTWGSPKPMKRVLRNDRSPATRRLRSTSMAR